MWQILKSITYRYSFLLITTRNNYSYFSEKLTHFDFEDVFRIPAFNLWNFMLKHVQQLSTTAATIMDNEETSTPFNNNNHDNYGCWNNINNIQLQQQQ